MKKPTVLEIPSDGFFPVRYCIVREDGQRTHPELSKTECEWEIENGFSDQGGEYVIIRKKHKSHPFVKVASVNGTCQADAESKAWIRGLINFQSPHYDPCERVVHLSDWAKIQTRQHLKAVGIKTRR